MLVTAVHPPGIDHPLSSISPLLILALEQPWHFQDLVIAGDRWPYGLGLTCGGPRHVWAYDGSAGGWYFGRKVQIIFLDNTLPSLAPALNPICNLAQEVFGSHDGWAISPIRPAGPGS